MEKKSLENESITVPYFFSLSTPSTSLSMEGEKEKVGPLPLLSKVEHLELKGGERAVVTSTPLRAISLLYVGGGTHVRWYDGTQEGCAKHTDPGCQVQVRYDEKTGQYGVWATKRLPAGTSVLVADEDLRFEPLLSKLPEVREARREHDKWLDDIFYWTRILLASFPEEEQRRYLMKMLDDLYPRMDERDVEGTEMLIDKWMREYHDWHPSDVVAHALFYRKLFSNAVFEGAEGAYCYWLSIPYSSFNHSCFPNARRVPYAPASEKQDPLFDRKRFRVVTLRQVEVGEEICTAYLPTHMDSREARQEVLRSTCWFTCTCVSCLPGSRLHASATLLWQPELLGRLCLQCGALQPEEGKKEEKGTRRINQVCLGACGLALYCSAACRAANWEGTHKEICEKMGEAHRKYHRHLEKAKRELNRARAQASAEADAEARRRERNRKKHRARKAKK
jgi:hypothetical protein